MKRRYFFALVIFSLCIFSEIIASATTSYGKPLIKQDYILALKRLQTYEDFVDKDGTSVVYVWPFYDDSRYMIISRSDEPNETVASINESKEEKTKISKVAFEVQGYSVDAIRYDDAFETELGAEPCLVQDYQAVVTNRGKTETFYYRTIYLKVRKYIVGMSSDSPKKIDSLMTELASVLTWK